MMYSCMRRWRIKRAMMMIFCCCCIKKFTSRSRVKSSRVELKLAIYRISKSLFPILIRLLLLKRTSTTIYTTCVCFVCIGFLTSNNNNNNNKNERIRRKSLNVFVNS